MPLCTSLMISFKIWKENERFMSRKVHPFRIDKYGILIDNTKLKGLGNFRKWIGYTKYWCKLAEERMNRLYSRRRACNFFCTFNVSVISILTLNRNMVYGSFYNQGLLFSFSQQTQFISSYRVSESRLTHRSYLLPPQHITIIKKKLPPLHLKLIT